MIGYDLQLHLRYRNSIWNLKKKTEIKYCLCTKCFTLPISFTGSYTEDETNFPRQNINVLDWFPFSSLTLSALEHIFNRLSATSWSVHTRRQVATRRGNRSLRVYRSGEYLQQHVAATPRSDKSLRVYWRICVKIFIAATVAKNQIRLNLYDLLRKQNSLAATKIFTKILQYHSERFVAATCRLAHVLICGWNPLVLTFKLNLFGRTFEDCYLCFRISEKGFDSFKTFFLRLQLEVKGLH